jgi:hypothetical protein
MSHPLRCMTVVIAFVASTVAATTPYGCSVKY